MKASILFSAVVFVLAVFVQARLSGEVKEAEKEQEKRGLWGWGWGSYYHSSGYSHGYGAYKAIFVLSAS